MDLFVPVGNEDGEFIGVCRFIGLSVEPDPVLDALIAGAHATYAAEHPEEK